MSILYKTDGTQEVLTGEITLERAQQLIGGYVERVCPKATPSIIFLCDEEGHIKGLPINAMGCKLYGTEHHGAPIAGDIIVMDRKEGRK